MIDRVAYQTIKILSGVTLFTKSCSRTTRINIRLLDSRWAKLRKNGNETDVKLNLLKKKKRPRISIAEHR